MLKYKNIHYVKDYPCLLCLWSVTINVPQVTEDELMAIDTLTVEFLDISHKLRIPYKNMYQVKDKQSIGNNKYTPSKYLASDFSSVCINCV